MRATLAEKALARGAAQWMHPASLESILPPRGIEDLDLLGPVAGRWRFARGRAPRTLFTQSPRQATNRRHADCSVGWGSGVAGAITVLLVVAVLAPLSILTLSLISEATTLLEQLRQSGGARQALQTLLSNPAVTPERLDPEQLELDAQQVLSFVQRHGGGALTAAGTIFGAATTAAIALVVFLYGFYTLLIHSQRTKAWLLDHSPLERWETLRLADAYEETGRGLLIGVGLTALFQGSVATLGYVLIGVPQPLVLGLLTTFSALIPTLGTGLVWAPLTVGLFIADRAAEATAVLVLGCVASVADNFIRPWLSRHARLDLPMFVLFSAMPGGIATFGAWGLLLGPLLVRLGLEALRLGRDRRELGEPSGLVRSSVDVPAGTSLD